MDTFRVHHILCTSLFIGRGYSGDFCINMSNVIDRIRKTPDEPLKIVCRPDIICAGCPNLIKSCFKSEKRNNENEVAAFHEEIEHCSLDDNHVEIKDKELADALGIVEGKEYSYRMLMDILRKRLSRDIFEKSCGKCSYYLDGTCSYDKLIDNTGHRKWRYIYGRSAGNSSNEWCSRNFDIGCAVTYPQNNQMGTDRK